jgi:hypothetical protein
VAVQGGYFSTGVDMVRIRKEPPTQDLDRAGCASSIPRSFVDHTNSLKVRPGTPHWAFHRPPREGRGAKTSACTCWCSRAPSIEI